MGLEGGGGKSVFIKIFLGNLLYFNNHWFSKEKKKIFLKLVLVYFDNSFTQACSLQGIDFGISNVTHGPSV